MTVPQKNRRERWIDAWIGGVADGTKTMSSRRMTSIEKFAGSLKSIKVVAKQRGVHLLLLMDDNGHKVVAASRHPFKVIV